MRRLRTIVAACALAGAAAPSVASAWLNPVIADDVPDPAVVRVAGTYWLSGTSSGHAPVFPLFRSPDLVRWRRVGAIFPVAPPGTRGGYWAPALAHRAGAWTVYYSAFRRAGPPCIFVARARSPLGPWRGMGATVCPRRGAIDPAPVRDAAGRRYLLWKGKGHGNWIFGARLSADGLRVRGRPVRLIRPDTPWEGDVVEGPDLVRHGRSYVLVYSGGDCCRRPCHYFVGAARAPSVLGPYVKDPANPILRDGGGWRCSGHGSLVYDRRGRLRYVHHAYRSDDPYQLDREVLLEPVTWAASGWPRIGDGGRPVPRAPGPPRVRFHDGFGGRRLAPGWLWPYDHPPALRVARGVLTLRRGSISRVVVAYDYVVTARVRRGLGELSILLQGGAKIGVVAQPKDDRLRIVVRRQRRLELFACRRGRACRRVGGPLVAPRAAARIRLDSGVYDAVDVRSLP